MPSTSQLTGMRGVYLVAAELSRHGFVASPTSRSARGADILATDLKCRRAVSIQVKANASTFSFWLVSEHFKEMVSDSHVYVFVNLRDSATEFFVVPSKVVARKVITEKTRGGVWRSFMREDALPYKDKWSVLRRRK